MILHAPEQSVTQTARHFFLLQENGFKILQEDGAAILSEPTSTAVAIIHAREVRQILHAAYESSVVSI